MAEQDESAERTEEPTPRKLDQARKDGQVLTSQEMLVFAAISAATVILLTLPVLGGAILQRWRAYLNAPSNLEPDALLAALGYAGRDILLAAGLIGLPVMLLMIGTQIAIGGLNWSVKGFAFKPEKIDPLKGFGRMFSLNSLVELSKAIGKVTLLGTVVLGGVYLGLDGLTVLGPCALGRCPARCVSSDLGHFYRIDVPIVLGGIALGRSAVAKSHKHRTQSAHDPNEVKRENRERIKALQRGERAKPAVNCRCKPSHDGRGAPNAGVLG